MTNENFKTERVSDCPATKGKEMAEVTAGSRAGMETDASVAADAGGSPVAAVDVGSPIAQEAGGSPVASAVAGSPIAMDIAGSPTTADVGGSANAINASGSPMTIAELQPDDIAGCLAIYNYYIENTCFTLEEQTLSPEVFQSRCLDIRDRYPFIVLKDDTGSVAGYAYLDTFNPRSAYRITADLSIYVDRRRTHEHLGEILLSAIEDLAKKRGITVLISIITSENLPSVRFHEKHDFEQTGFLRDVAVKFGRHLSVSYFRKGL